MNAVRRPYMDWICRDRVVKVGERTLVMGILNVTPDSFSDGGRFDQKDAAVAHGLRMCEAGADILDIGGESTRPGAMVVNAEEECNRVIPVIKALRSQLDVPISIDTMKAAVAREAVAAGADIINDVSALTADPEMMAVVAESGAGIVLMHMLRNPQTMQNDPQYEDVVVTVRDYLAERLQSCRDAGIAPERIALDPGIGFGKTVDHNLELLARLDALRALGCPVLVGLSRKSFLGHVTGAPVEERMAASVAGHAYAITRGAHIIRVHDVKESCDTVALVDKLVLKENEHGDIGSY